MQTRWSALSAVRGSSVGPGLGSPALPPLLPFHPTRSLEHRMSGRRAVADPLLAPGDSTSPLSPDELQEHLDDHPVQTPTKLLTIIARIVPVLCTAAWAATLTTVRSSFPKCSLGADCLTLIDHRCSCFAFGLAMAMRFTARLPALSRTSPTLWPITLPRFLRGVAPPPCSSLERSSSSAPYALVGSSKR